VGVGVVKLRRVYEGERISMPVEGGYVMREAPESGFVVEQAAHLPDLFVPWSAVRELEAELKKGKR